MVQSTLRLQTHLDVLALIVVFAVKAFCSALSCDVAGCGLGKLLISGKIDVVFHCNEQGMNSSVMCALCLMLLKDWTFTAAVP